MADLLQRVATALVLAGIGLAAVLAHPYTFLLLVLGLNALTLHEFYRLFHAENGYSPSAYRVVTVLRHLAGIAVPVLVFGVAAASWPANMLWLLAAIVPLFLVAELYLKSGREAVNVAVNVAGVAYIAVPFALMVLLAFQTGAYEPRWPIGLMLLVVANDVFAYFTGRLLGRTKLMERISPKKTVEGFVGGAIFALLAGAGMYYWFGLRSLGDWLALAAIAAVFGTLGDLAESMLKRNRHVKDSGSMLPGHGGLLDRFDALLMAVPFWAVYLFLL